MRHGVLSMVLAGTALLCSTNADAAGPFIRKSGPEPPTLSVLNTSPDEVQHEPTRLIAAGLAVTLGPFGAHRLYLGTTAKVPVFYGLTFGGFGVLVLIDLGHILFTKDLTPYQHNKQILMWAGKAPPTVTTPP